jgi:CARDB protein
MTERETMTERDTDIEFDFFEEPETREPERKERLPRRRGPRPPRPPEGMTPLLRLVGLIVLAVAVVVGLVLLIDNLRGDSKQSRYQDYLDEVAVVATQSQQIGRDLDNLLNSPVEQQDVQAELNGLAEREEQVEARARDLDPPGPLRSHHQQLVEALLLRVSGLRGLADAFARTAGFQRPPRAGDVLAEQARRLSASDVVWDDLFKVPAARELERQGVRGVAVPDSNFLEDPQLATRQRMALIWKRINNATTPPPEGALRGNGIVSVEAVGRETVQLSTQDLNQIVATPELRFRVVVENSGEAQEVQVPVTLTIQRAVNPIQKRFVIESINPGQRQTVTFSDIGLIASDFGEQTTLQVAVEPVEDAQGEVIEENTSNNSYDYPVIFSVP